MCSTDFFVVLFKKINKSLKLNLQPVTYKTELGPNTDGQHMQLQKNKIIIISQYTWAIRFNSTATLNSYETIIN